MLISAVKPYGKNAKLHPPEQIEQIKKSIQEFGNNDPIAIDENDVIIEGHGRLEALKLLRFKEIEVTKLTHLSEEQKKAYILVHNKLTMNTGFDFNILDAELAKIENVEMQDFGFEMNEINEEDFDTDFSLSDEGKPDEEQMTFSLHKKQAELVKSVLEFYANENSMKTDSKKEKGDVLYEIAKEWMSA
jgi:hypothetical protein